MTSSLSVPTETLDRTAPAIDPEWTVLDATPADRGHHVVYHLEIDDGGDRRTFVL